MFAPAFYGADKGLAAQNNPIWHDQSPVSYVGNHFKGTPYGGYKNSGVGRESCLEELLSYTEVKTIQIFL